MPLTLSRNANGASTYIHGLQNLPYDLSRIVHAISNIVYGVSKLVYAISNIVYELVNQFRNGVNHCRNGVDYRRDSVNPSRNPVRYSRSSASYTRRGSNLHRRIKRSFRGLLYYSRSSLCWITDANRLSKRDINLDKTLSLVSISLVRARQNPTAKHDSHYNNQQILKTLLPISLIPKRDGRASHKKICLASRGAYTNSKNRYPSVQLYRSFLLSDRLFLC